MYFRSVVDCNYFASEVSKRYETILGTALYHCNEHQ